MTGALLVGVACSSSTPPGAPAESTEDGPDTLPSGAPSFPLPTDPAATIRASGLPEHAPDVVKGVHFHTHIDLEIDGHAVVIPAGIGKTKTGSSPVFTEPDLGADNPGSTGIVHVEAEVTEPPQNYSVGQFFSEWGVVFDKNCIATYCNDDHNQLLGFRNGELVPDPSSIPFIAGDQVSIWYGPRGSNPSVSADYEFPAGL